ncbi:hypothetical protein BDF20DRAFT_878775 [Mycotypha africana]|uniref:uncharacterized protein n=1 Tax=Mycotypha africana TaxID=64632 RepID=UPI002300BE6F|nr:uncharacterized protein BDF20DRAFT_878775 [Mycotypha africana]KAI8975452.1 hypothetical protein BDF20DRAFT_878775 [Mycotypha africana]
MACSANLLFIGTLWRALRTREAGDDLLAIIVDKYLTSRICDCCCSDTLQALTPSVVIVSLFTELERITEPRCQCSKQKK